MKEYKIHVGSLVKTREERPKQYIGIVVAIQQTIYYTIFWFPAPGFANIPTYPWVASELQIINAEE